MTQEPPAAPRGRRPVPRALTRVLVALGVLIASGVVAALLLDGVLERGDLSVLDQPTLTWFVDHREPLLTSVMIAVSVVGGEVVMSVIAALTVLLLVWRRRRVEAVLVAAALGAAEAVSLLLKHAVGRARPPAPDVLGPVEGTLSFPSGHTIVTATFALVLAYLWWRAGPGWRRVVAGLLAAGLVTATMAASRLYLADHWLTDVLGSIALATGVVAAVALGDQLWQRRARRTADRAEAAP